MQKNTVNKLRCGLFLINKESEHYILFQNQPESQTLVEQIGIPNLISSGSQVWESDLFNAPLQARVRHT